MSHRITTIKLSLFITLCACFGMAPDAYAVTRTWDGEGGDNNWSTGANWSGNTVPTNADDVVFDATSVKDSIWDSSGPANIRSFSASSAYTGAFTLAKTSVTIGVGNWTWAGTGAFSAGTGKVSFAGTGPTFTPGNAYYYEVEYVAPSGTPSFAVSGTANIVNFTLNGSGSSVSASGTMNVSGNISVLGTANIHPNSTVTITMNGTGNQSISSAGGGGLSGIVINKPSGNITLSGIIPITNSFTYTAGTMYASGSTLKMLASFGGGTFVSGPSAYYDTVEFYGTTGSTNTYSISGTVNANNVAFTGTGASQALSGGAINVSGNLSTEQTYMAQASTTVVTLNGTGTQTLSCGTGHFGALTINKPAGKVVLSGTVRIRGNFNWISGNLEAGTSTLEFTSPGGLLFTPGSGTTYYNVQINLNGSAFVTLGGNLKLSNALSVAGYFATSNYSVTAVSYSQNGGRIDLGSSLVKLSGNFSYTPGTFNQGTSTLLLTGTNQTITGSTTFYNLYKLLPPETTGTLTFAASSTTTIAAGGTARFMGTRGYPLSLRSSTPTTQYTITKTGSAVVEYADIQDAVISGATSAVSSTNSGNNGVNWTFTREFVSTIRASGGDYTTLSGWESAIQADLTAATTKVFNHGGITGSIPDNSSVTGFTSGATGTAVHVTSTQILIKSITGTFQSGEQVRIDGSNYVTISDAGTGAIATAECYNDWRTGLNDAVSVNGWTTDSDNYTMITVPLNQRHRGKLTDTVGGYYRGFTLKPSADPAFQAGIIMQNRGRVEGVAFDMSGTTNSSGFVGHSGSADSLLSGFGRFGFTLGSGGSFTITNSIAYGASQNCFEDSLGSSFSYTAYNVTAQGCAVGFEASNTGGNMVLKNALASGNATADFALTNTGTKSVTYSASSDATADDYGTTTGDRVSQTFTFRDATNKDFHLNNNDTGAKDVGLDLSSDSTFPLTTDIDGRTRPEIDPANSSRLLWDIGADESR